jgi:2-keto-4-pentenoate hydratase/2-oxohepta-3-ene-1,7-dioic acid hydratase in catechol pathway
MRLATYLGAGAEAPRVGVVSGEPGAAQVHPVQDVATMRELVGLGLAEALVRGERALSGPGEPLSGVRLMVPLEPASVRDFVAFEEHVEGVRRSVDGASGVPEAWYDAPTFYFTNPHTLIGPEDEVPFPATSVARDLELEVAVVVGRGGRSLSQDEARDHVFGYTLLNDWSARDLQGREMQVGLGPAKGKDFASSLGPWIVTADELEPFRDADGFLELECRVEVNGEVVGTDLLSNMGWTFEAMIAHASRDSRVVPGDVLGSGTTGHGGCLAELWGLRGTQDPPPLRGGDVVTLHVEGVGWLRNVVATAPSAPPTPAFRAPSRRRTRS